MILFYFMFRKKAEKRKDVIKMAKELNLQDVFLNQARKEKIRYLSDTRANSGIWIRKAIRWTE